MGDFAKGIKAFKAGMKEEEETAEQPAHQQVPPPAGTASAAAAGDIGSLRRQRARPARLTRRAAGSAEWPQPAASRWRDQTLRPLPNDRLEIRHDPVKGRGVFASAAIGAGALIEAAPVIIVPVDQRTLLDRTVLHDYYFVWDEEGGESRARASRSVLCRCAIIRGDPALAYGATAHARRSICWH